MKNLDRPHLPCNWGFSIIRAMEIPVELKTRYLRRRLEELNRLKLSLENDDFSIALSLGHQVKGNAVTFELPDIGLLGSKIELAAKNKNKEEVQFLAQEMRNFIEKAQSFL